MQYMYVAHTVIIWEMVYNARGFPWESTYSIVANEWAVLLPGFSPEESPGWQVF
jgi:hypothetical protein